MTPGCTRRRADGRARGSRRRFERGIGFRLDPFQHRAMDAIDRGESVLVSAPTGSGKTLVADYAVARALDGGGKAFYTTPIKALSNQKFAELAARYGAHRVGLLTGDVSHQPRAPIVVMTTEVLRNMLFARSSLLDDLRVVVLDEVHYLQDPYRGSVWEEVLVLTPPGVAFVSLSATVDNADRLRPMAHLGAGPHPGGGRDPPTGHPPPPLRGGRTGPRRGVGAASAPQRRRQPRRAPPRRPAQARRPPALPGTPADRGGRVPRTTPGMLPGHHLHLLACGLRRRHPPVPPGRVSASPPTRSGPGSGHLVEDSVERLSDDDLRTLGYGPWSAALEAGVAPHHAGLVPAFRQAVERCFSEGLLKVVFATETLALGYQHAGPHRGGRAVRQVPGLGHVGPDLGGVPAADRPGGPARASTPWATPSCCGTRPPRFGLVARTAVAPPPDLVSSFHPTYNLAVNLVRRWSREEAHGLLESSYGQWQAPRGLRVPGGPVGPAPGHPGRPGLPRRLAS